MKNQLKVSRLYNAQAQKVLARCFVVGLLVGLLATQNFAQNAGDTNASSVSHSTESTGPSIAASTSGAQSSTTSIAPALPLASLSQVVVSKPANFSAFAPELTQPSASLSNSSPKSSNANFALLQNDQAQTSNPPKRGIRKGYLVLAIVGVGVAAFGVDVYAHHAPGAGTIFFAPGAAAAGIGFFFAFHHRD